MEGPKKKLMNEVRNIWRSGDSLVVCIPKRYIEEQNLKEGDHLQFTSIEGLLIGKPIERTAESILEEIREADAYEQEQREKDMKNLPPLTKEELERIKKLRKQNRS